MKSIGDRIKETRKAAGLNQPQLAKAVGVSKAAVGRLENGQSNAPTPANLLKYAKALNVDVKWLVTGKGEKISPNNNINKPNLDDREQEIINIYRNLSKDNQDKLWGMAHMLDIDIAEPDSDESSTAKTS